MVFVFPFFFATLLFTSYKISSNKNLNNKDEIDNGGLDSCLQYLRRWFWRPIQIWSQWSNILHLSSRRRVYATDGLCTHEDIHLVDGLIDGEEIECPMHLGVFNIKTGKVVLDPPCEDLKIYKLKVEDEQIFIEL